MRHHRGHHHRRGPLRLRAVLVRWFGATIVASGVAVAAVWWALAPEPRAWNRMGENLQAFVGSEFAGVWHDPAQRSALAERVARQLEIEITLRDADDRVLERHGPECDGRTVSIDVRGSDQRLGSLTACWIRPGLAHFVPMLAALAAALAVLWATAGLLARRLTRPYDTLTRFARRLADGELDARLELGCEIRGEPAVVAAALNDMAARVQTQLAEAHTLLAAVSHEIRTPLGHLRVLAELLRDRGGDDATLQDLEREIADLDALVGKLLADARLQFSALSPTTLSGRAIAARALALAGMSPALLEASEGDDTLIGDPTLLGRALGNLLENARDHGDGVTALRLRFDGDAVVFEVDDAGPGVNPEQRARAFEPFVRGDDTGSRGRLGLGLALVRRIALAHGGDAWIEARPSGGATAAFSVHRRGTTE